MISKNCSRCGRKFYIYNKKYNARKYCTNCGKPDTIITLCKYCGNPFSTHDQRRKYCSKSCSIKARQDKNLEYVVNYYKRYPWKKIKRGLGTGILKEHMQKDSQKESNQIKAEMKRIGLK